MSFTISEEKVKKEFEGLNWMPELRYDTIGERIIHYAEVVQGKDCLVVFVHGSPGSWSAFMEYMKSDSLLANVDMISIDRPGFGLSDRGWPEPSMKKQAYLLQEVINSYPHQDKILVGHSLGGPVIARMAMDYPDLVSGLILLAPSIDPEMEKGEWYRSWMQTKVIGALTPEDFWVSNEEIVPLKAELEEMLPLWKQIIAPAIVVQGTKDMLVPKENADFAQEVIADSLIEVRLLEGANHFIPWSHDYEVAKAIQDMYTAMEEND
ncbi:MAG: alpha/beta hydrolase [Cyclobacteriaceae bacterium]|nr:alpha/beta hydrolase [Cyclobacteriaceae bacterium HetDA_MAG_MS6]